MQKTITIILALSSLLLLTVSCQDDTTIVSKKTTETITIDGDLSEKVYQQASKVFLKNSIDGQAIADDNYSTSAQIFHDEQNLYIAFVSNDLDIHSSFTKRDEHLWKDEAVEVFIDTDDQPNDYIEIEVSPKNVLYDSYIVNPDKIDVAATKKFDLKNIQTAVQVNGTVNARNDKDKNWTVEMAIPFAELIQDFDANQLKEYQWKINLYRINQDDNPLALIAWQPTGNRFHRPEKFGTIIFR